MKIGILTYHRARNYGAFMQAYALQQQLHRKFPNINFEIIDFEYKRNYIKRKIDYIKQFVKCNWGNLCDIATMDKAFKREYSKLPLSKHIISNNTSKHIDNLCKKYDCIIIGSDAVFNWTQDPIPNIYFFNSENCKHLTYAASAHLNRYKEATVKQSEYVKDSLSKMAYIGVRDAETEKFVHYFNPQCSCAHNCDPTVVLDMNYIVPTLEKKMQDYGIKKEDKIIILMLKEEKIGEYIRRKYQNEYKIVAVRKKNKYADIFINDLTPLEWSKIFSYANLTITDFFHGSLLSLKNQTPVISIDSSKYAGYESKAKDLFEKRLKFPEMFYDMTIPDDDKKILIQKCENLLANDYADAITDSLRIEGEAFDEFCKTFEDLMELK